MTKFVPICVLIGLGIVACDKDRNDSQPADDPRAGEGVTATATKQKQASQAPNGTTFHFMVDPGAAKPELARRAVARLEPTAGNTVNGTVEFAETNAGLEVKASVEDLPPGRHAYHVHLLGDCTQPDGTSAGTHFNFKGSSKNPPSDIERITGNLGELVAGDDGRASGSTNIEVASLQGSYSILGRSVIVHENGNDVTQPPIGAAGKRLACGTIGLTE